MIKVLIADDHPIMRRGLRQLLTEEPNITTVGEAQTCREVIELAYREPWDIVILDITMPGRGGLDVLRELKQNRPRLPVLILSMHPEDQYGVRALTAGAAGYMTKESAPEHLISAIRKIMAGGKYVSSSLAEKLAFGLHTDAQRPTHEALSDREYQVLCLIASGKTLTEIGDELSLSIKTISTHRSHILKKMHMKTNAELTMYAWKNSLLQ